MKALVTGGTGMVGPRLLRLLDKPTVLSRNPDRARQSIGHLAGRIVGWDPMQGPPPAEAFDGVEAVFHLAGESVAGSRWTAAQKARIRDSRVTGTRHLVQAEELGVRVVTERTGIVLGHGGALAKMLTPFKLGAGGPLGNGRQWMPWVHVGDLVRLYVHAAEHASIRGPMNAVAPNPVRNSEFTKALGRQLRRPAFMPAPYIGLRIVFGEFAQVLFASQRVIPEVAIDTGFTFEYPEIAGALKEILAPAAA